MIEHVQQELFHRYMSACVTVDSPVRFSLFGDDGGAGLVVA